MSRAIGRLQKRRSPAARVIARAWPLDLDHVGAEIGQHLPTHGPAMTRLRSRTLICESGPGTLIPSLFANGCLVAFCISELRQLIDDHSLHR